VRLDPFPFGDSPARFTLARLVLPKRDYDGNESFRRDFAAAPVEVVDIVVEAA
jgi:hypothetical protein